MEGGAAAPSSSTASSSTGADAGTADAVAGANAGDGLTDTEDLPLPVAPYALVSGYPRQRRRCFYDGYDECRKTSR